MALLVSNEIYNAICNELRDARDSVQIITAYCKLNTLKNLIKQIDESVLEKKIMVRFRLDDLLKGSTDFGILELCLKSGWQVYIRFDLHAKTYIVDNKRGIVGSANATTNGMLGQGGNFEIATLDNIDAKDIKKIECLYRDAIRVDWQLLEKMKLQYEQQNIHSAGSGKSWSNDIKALFRPKIDTLFSHELPDSNDFIQGQLIPFLDVIYSGSKEELKNAFRWSNAYLWLLTKLEENNGCLYFGNISALLHNAVVSDPKPYRRDIKNMLANMLSLIEWLEMDEIVIDRPGYSQRVRLAKSNRKELLV